MALPKPMENKRADLPGLWSAGRSECSWMKGKSLAVLPVRLSVWLWGGRLAVFPGIPLVQLSGRLQVAWESRGCTTGKQQVAWEPMGWPSGKPSESLPERMEVLSVPGFPA